MGSKMKPMCNSVALWASAARGTSRGLAPPAPAGLMGRCPHGTQAVAPRSQHKLLAAYLAQEGSAVFGSTGPRGPKGRYFWGEPAPRTTLWLEFPKEKSLSSSTSILFFLSGCFCFGVLGSGWGKGKTRTTLDKINLTAPETAGSRAAAKLYRQGFTMRCP